MDPHGPHGTQLGDIPSGVAPLESDYVRNVYGYI